MARLTRRSFLGLAATTGILPSVAVASAKRDFSTPLAGFERTPGLDPWIEVSAKALRHNAVQVSKLSGGRPILAVVKNNAYGLGLRGTAEILNSFPEISGFAAVKASSCLALRDQGIKKDVLLMGLTPEDSGEELVRQNIQLSVFTEEFHARIDSVAQKAGKQANVHFYLDTGMSRMGMPYRDALPWMESVSSRSSIKVKGTYMAFTEEPDFDPEQLRRFRSVVEKARTQQIPVGQLHAASSNGVFHLPEAHLDIVRPGIALFGAYPSRPAEEKQIAELIPAFSLKSRVVRVARLLEGDSVSYGRNYVASRPTWIATLAIGHADGYPREAVDGARILIAGDLYPVIGAISASHTIVELGDTKTVTPGDVATHFGPDMPAIHPNNFADTVGVSVYDVLMHMNSEMPRKYV